MTNLNNITEGYNKFCGPAVLSIITGRSTDECANVIGRVTGNFKVKEVFINDLLKAMKLLDMDYIAYEGAGSLYATIVRYIGQDGMYIISTPTHYVVIEINNKQVFFCDNHTKHPIPAASSARLGNQVVTIHKVWVKEAVKIELMSEKIDVEWTTGKAYIKKYKFYNDSEYDVVESIGSIRYDSLDELEVIISRLTKHLMGVING